MRIVFDTNIYISAALHGRQAETILELASSRQLALLISPAILDELKGKLLDKLNWTGKQTEFFLATIQNLTEMIEPQERLSVVSDDDDNRILECAIAGQADLIVTHDQDLLRLKSYETVGIVTPRELTFYGFDRGAEANSH